MDVLTVTDAHRPTRLRRPNRRGAATRHEILVAAVALIEHLSLPELLALLPTPLIARHAGRSERAIRHHFRSVEDFRSALTEAADTDPDQLRACLDNRRTLAAISFECHLPAIRQAAEHHRDRDPDRPLADALCELTRRARQDPATAWALLQVRIGGDPACSGLVERLVPLDAVVQDADPELDATSARRVVDTCLMLARSHPRAAPAGVAQWSLLVR